MKKQTMALAGMLIAATSIAQTPANNAEQNNRLTHVPQWAREAVWYQIFVERFRNGDTTNDPTAESIKDYVHRDIPTGWKVTPWTQDWYKPDPWMANLSYPNMNFAAKLQYRRYGGDLQGVLDKLDYLKELGITAIYFTPLNDAPSLHKYDAAYWHHIDRHLGPTPAKDGEQMLMEKNDAPSDWVWTNADKLFLKVIDEAHRRGIKVVMDYSWNHTGTNFWAFQDLLRKGSNSPYKDWYIVNRFDNPATPENEFDYKGWSGVNFLAEIRETVHHPDSVVSAYEGNIYSDEAKQHMFAVVKRWADPNGDGDPSDGIDGLRLDVAAELPLGFWREFRQVARQLNPEMYLVGEVWWEKWPDRLLDPRPFVKGDVFDANMNYRWFRSARHFFNDSPTQLSIKDFISQMNFIFGTVRPEVAEAYMNVMGTHDSPRLSTALYNKGKYKYMVKPYDDPSYRINKPDADTYKVMEQFLVHQFTFIGSPQIWNGDEMGMWGGDDPDTRKPLIWPDYKFEDEAVHPLGLPKPKDKVSFDSTLFNFYKKLVNVRKSNPVFSKGALAYTVTDEAKRVLAYSRSFEKKEGIAAFNLSSKSQKVAIPTKYNQAYVNQLNQKVVLKPTKGKVTITLPPKGYVVLVNK